MKDMKIMKNIIYCKYTAKSFFMSFMVLKIKAVRPMIRIKSATDAPDFKSPSREAYWQMYPLA